MHSLLGSVLICHHVHLYSHSWSTHTQFVLWYNTSQDYIYFYFFLYRPFFFCSISHISCCLLFDGCWNQESWSIHQIAMCKTTAVHQDASQGSTTHLLPNLLTDSDSLNYQNPNKNYLQKQNSVLTQSLTQIHTHTNPIHCQHANPRLLMNNQKDIFKGTWAYFHVFLVWHSRGRGLCCHKFLEGHNGTLHNSSCMPDGKFSFLMTYCIFLSMHNCNLLFKFCMENQKRKMSLLQFAYDLWDCKWKGKLCIYWLFEGGVSWIGLQSFLLHPPEAESLVSAERVKSFTNKKGWGYILQASFILTTWEREFVASLADDTSTTTKAWKHHNAHEDHQILCKYLPRMWSISNQVYLYE